MLCKFDDLDDREPAHYQVNGLDLVAIRYDDDVSVLSGRWLHRGVLMSDGYVDGKNEHKHIQPMIKTCIENLNQLKDLLEVIPGEVYKRKSKFLSGATIGGHMRHILEFYTCLLDGVMQQSDAPATCVVNYGKRARDVEIETWPEKALATIDFICEELSSVRHWPETVCNEGQHDSATDTITRIRSSFDRELLYNLEHAIHHQAFIRVSLLEQDLEDLVDENFGVAPSTIRAKKTG
ncbi:MAG: hypothetical protein R6U28_07000 [Cyclonatronaceae bacterium]